MKCPLTADNNNYIICSVIHQSMIQLVWTL